MTRNRVLFTVSALIMTLMSSFKPDGNNSIELEIHNLRSDKGHVLISLYDKEKGFPEEAAKYAVGKAKVPIRNGKATANFKDLPAGKYAIAIMHDENNNNKMDYNILGMPKEGFGFSNDAKVTLGPPSFDKAAFEVNGVKTARIKMSYL